MDCIVGERFGKLVVLEKLPSIRDRSGSLRQLVKVACDCGNLSEKKVKYLKNGDTSSCGNCITKVVGVSRKGVDVFLDEPFPTEIQLVGETFHYWKVISVGYRMGKNRAVEVFCRCGNKNFISKRALIAGKSLSCGCYSSEYTAKAKTSHGMSHTKEYVIWLNMKARCNRESNESYINYGARGITYPTEWEKFSNFWEDMGKTYKEGLELDRIDVDGNYSKENCRWVDGFTQSYNRRKFKNNTSGRTGVYYDATSEYWKASISFNGDRINLGKFRSFDEAVYARETAEANYYSQIKE